MSVTEQERTAATAAGEGVPRPSGPPRAVTWRSIALGLLGVVFICGLTPYNDYVVNNTFLVGNYLPVGLLLLFVVFSLVVNAPLARIKRSWALTTGEISVAFAMALVSCALPSSGLMRYLPANLVVFHHQAGQNPDHADLLRQLNLPSWIFPTTASEELQFKANDPVVRQFIERIPQLQDKTLLERFLALPWEAWLTPALSWSLLLGCLGGMILCGVVILRAQWSDNERLPFPLAGVFQAVIEQPEQGRLLNPLLSSRLFWMAFAAVFAIHGINALSAYFPRNIPQIPLGYDFFAVLSQPPASYTEWYFKRSQLYFCVIGLVYFLQSSVSFSLWFFVVLLQVVMMVLGTYQIEFSDGMRADQNFGAVVAFAVSILFVGRAHWLLVMRQMLRGRRGDEPAGRYIAYPVAGWGLLLCTLGVMVWLVMAGCTWIGAAVLVLLLQMFFLVVARVVAETGIPFVQVNAQVFRVWTFLAPLGVRTTAQTFFFTSWFHGLFVHDMRESAAVYTGQALRVADQGAYEQATTWRRTWPLAACLVVALAVGFVVSGAAMLYVEYNHAAPLDRGAVPPINPYAITGQPISQILNPSANYALGGTGANDKHSTLGHFTFGAAVTAFLAMMRLRFAAWPLHPVGFLLFNSYPMRMIWFSVLIGWLCKALVVRFGGIELFRALRPLFLGLIVGEAAAVAFWLATNLVLVELGIEYIRTNILPT
ncbi:MAG: DUF6785 family protein [Tepidisphaerales bacterium]